METNIMLVTEREAARLLAVSTAALRRWRHEGRGPRFVRCERCVRYDLRAIEEFCAENSSSQKKGADCESAPKSEVRNGRAALRT